VCEKKNENVRGRGRERGTDNEQKRGGANVERENGEEREKAIKAGERCRGCLTLFDTFASDDSSPFAVPSPLSQRACQRNPREHDPRHSRSNEDVKRKYADFVLIFGCEKKEQCTSFLHIMRFLCVK
jgi:hypothetical protein